MGAGQSLKLGEEIGRGAYGTVHKGTYQGKPVAIKRIHQLLLENARYHRSDYDHVQQEFVRECDLLASLDHPHVVKFIGVLDVEGDKALVMELLQETLKDYLSKKKDVGMEVAEARRITFQIVEGLKYLHGHDPPLVHRDLNGKNVLLTETGLVKISDLGQAKYRPSDLGYLTTKAPGCLPYMAPEVLGKDPQYTEKMDMFSLGVLMLQIVTLLDPAPDLQGIGVVAEVERRRDHLKMVEETHPLRIPIVTCLENDPKKRPSAGTLFKSEMLIRCMADNCSFENLKPFLPVEEKVVFRIALIGGSSSGRSTYFDRYDRDIFTQGSALSKFCIKSFNDEKYNLRIDIFTVSGRTAFSRDYPTFLRNAHGCLLTFYVTEKTSLYEDAVKCLERWRKCCSVGAPVILVGTKCDLEEKREVSLAEMEKFTEDHNLEGCIEVSSYTGYNVKEAMNLLIYHMVTNPVILDSGIIRRESLALR